MNKIMSNAGNPGKEGNMGSENPGKFTLLFPNSVPLSAYFYTHPNYTDIRRAKLMLFGDCLSSYDKFRDMPYKGKIHILKHIERGCYHTTRKKGNKRNLTISWDSDAFTNLYHTICYKIAVNLDKRSLVGSSHLANDILSGKILPHKVAASNSQEMCPDKYVGIQQKIKLMHTPIKIKTSKLYFCGKCKKNETIIKSQIDRSGDENSSLIVTCVYCGYQWRMAG